jgi:hypothetical protein
MHASARRRLATVDARNKIRMGNPLVTVIEREVPVTFSSDQTKKENQEISKK